MTGTIIGPKYNGKRGRVLDTEFGLRGKERNRIVYIVELDAPKDNTLNRIRVLSHDWLPDPK